jgi:hypothetical protein
LQIYDGNSPQKGKKWAKGGTILMYAIFYFLFFISYLMNKEGQKP